MLCVCKNWNAELNHRKIVVVMSLTAEGFKTFSYAYLWTVPITMQRDANINGPLRFGILVFDCRFT